MEFHSFRIIQDFKVDEFTCCVYFFCPVHVYEPGHEKMCLMSYAKNNGADQPAQSDQRLCYSLLS